MEVNGGIALIVFDCDGVLIDSVDIKTDAFAKMAAPYGGEAVKEMVAYHLANGGVSRMRKFEWFFKEVLGRPIAEDEINRMGKRFTELVLEGVLASPLIPGVMETLRALHGRLPLYVASGTPQPELRTVLQKKSLSSFFIAAYGTPPNKAQQLQQIITRERLLPKQALMVGDSRTDLDAARLCGVPFFGINTNFSTDPWPSGTDCLALLRWLEKFGGSAFKSIYAP